MPRTVGTVPPLDGPDGTESDVMLPMETVSKSTSVALCEVSLPSKINTVMFLPAKVISPSENFIGADLQDYLARYDDNLYPYNGRFTSFLELQVYDGSTFLEVGNYTYNRVEVQKAANM